MKRRFDTVNEWLEWQQTLHPKNIDFKLERIKSVYKKLNIKKLHAITGGSIGGCLTWEIAAKKPDIAKFIIPVASDWKARDWMIANTYLQDRILSNSRNPVQDARIHAMTFYRSPESFSK